MNAALEKRLKRQVIGKLHRFQAVVPLGFEQTFVNELEFIRQQSHVVGDGKIEFTTKLTEAWKVVAYSRIANRVLMHIADFKAENFRELEKKAAEIPWELYLLDERTGEALQTKDERRKTTTIQGERRDQQSWAWPSRMVGTRAKRVSKDERVESRPTELGMTEPNGWGLSNAKGQRFNCNVIPSNARDPVKFTNTLSIHVTCKHSRLYHSDAIAERLYNVISQSNISQSEASSEVEARPHTPWFNRLTNRFIAVASDHTLQNLYVTLIDDRCTIWLDLAGEELYKRGFERFVNDAPLKETIAAAMIFEAINCVDPISKCYSGNNGSYRLRLQDDRNGVATLTTNHQHQTTLLDLMAGSGTFSLETACIANNIIPGACRDFALMHQPAFKEATWKHILDERRKTKDERWETKELQVVRRGDEFTSDSHNENHCKNERFIKIITSDISPKAISIIKHNVECSPLASITPNPINPQLRDFFSYTAKEIAEACGDTSPILVLNPPYGKRLDFDAPKLYTKIGKKLADLARELKAFNKALTVAILAPKDDTREGSKYTCTANLLRESPALAPNKNSTAKLIETSHGGFSLNAFIAKI